MRVQLTNNNVKYLGRTMLFGDTLFLSLSGSGIEFNYSGKGFNITFVGGSITDVADNEGNFARIRIYINETVYKDFLLDEKLKTIRVEDRLPGTGENVIRIIKLSECAMSLVGIKPLDLADGESISPTPDKKYKIEFIGDSITCGYGVDDPDPMHNFKTGTEDVTKAFAYKTAKALDTDYSMFSISGYGIISGYTDNPQIRHDEQLIPTFYESMGLSYDALDGLAKSQDIPWDFNRYVPDVVVLNLGTNDDSYCQEDKERQAKFASLYVDFLKTIRKYNQTAYIVCAFGLMGDRLYPTICGAVDTYRSETGDERITTVHLPEQDAGKVGYGADYHPLESEHTKAADTLIPVIRDILK